MPRVLNTTTTPDGQEYATGIGPFRSEHVIADGLMQYDPETHTEFPCWLDGTALTDSEISDIEKQQELQRLDTCVPAAMRIQKAVANLGIEFPTSWDDAEAKLDAVTDDSVLAREGQRLLGGKTQSIEQGYSWNDIRKTLEWLNSGDLPL